VKNLDLLAAQTAQGIISNTEKQKASDVENLITKALGVLQENGVYAALLYLYSRSSKNEQPIAQQTRLHLLHLTSELALKPPTDRQVEDKIVIEDAKASIALQFLTDRICNDLDRLLLVKQLWEQTLIYARYGAKAQEAEVKEREGKNKRKEAEVKA